MKTRLSLAFMAIAFFAATWVEGEGQIAVIAHKSVATERMDLSRLTDIYTLNSQQWKDGSRVVVVDLKGTNPLKIEFYRYLKMTPPDMQKIWLRKQFSGKAVPPTPVNLEEEALQKVASTPGAIGYVRAELVTKDVQVIATLP